MVFLDEPESPQSKKAKVPTADELIRRAGDLQVLPTVAKRVLDEVQKETTTALLLSQIIEKDQTITARILKISNSAFYGLRREVKSLQQAVMIIGFKALKSLVIATSTRSLYRQFGITEQLMWDHSVGSAIAARLIAEGMGPEIEEIAFIGGLMHDVGKVVMNNETPEAFLEVMKEIYNEGVESIEAENTIYGYDHTEIGAGVTGKWGLPGILVEIIRNHHLTQGDFDSISVPEGAKGLAVVHLANQVCKRLGIGYRQPDESIDLAALRSSQYLKLAPNRIEALLERVGEAYKTEKAAFA